MDICKAPHATSYSEALPACHTHEKKSFSNKEMPVKSLENPTPDCWRNVVSE